MTRSTDRVFKDCSEVRASHDAAAKPSTLFHALAARIWDEVTEGAGVVYVSPSPASERVRMDALALKGEMSAERARLARHARLKSEAAAARAGPPKKAK